MLDALFIILRRICVCGMFSAIVMAITADASQREIARVCCACVMIIAIFMPAPKNTLADIPEFSQDSFQIEAERAMQSFQQNQKEAMCRKIEEYAANRAGEGKFIVEAEIEDSELIIGTITVHGANLNKPEIVKILKAECGAASSEIIFVE